MKKNLLIFFAFLQVICCFAQVKSKQISAKEGQIISISSSTSVEAIVGSDNYGYYVLKSKRRNPDKYYYYISKFNHNLDFELEEKINLDYKHEKRDFEFIVQFNKKLYVFSSYTNHKNDEKVLFRESINTKALWLNNDLIEVNRIDYKTIFYDGYFAREYSPDSSKLVIFHFINNSGVNSDLLYMQVFDQEMKLMWQDKVSLVSDTSEPRRPHELLLSNQGEVYVLSNIRDSTIYKNYKNNYRVSRFSFDSERQNEYSFSLPEKYIMGAHLSLANLDTKNPNVIITGFYSNRNLFAIKGSFWVQIQTETGEELNRNITEFSADFMSQFMRAKKAQRGRELYDFSFNEIVTGFNGQNYVIAEQRFTSASNQYADYYNYNNLLVINYSTNGNITWMKKITKEQGAEDRWGGYSSYCTFECDSTIHFVFNDDPNNLFLKHTRRTYRFEKYKESLLVDIETDDNSNIQKEAIIVTQNNELIPRPVTAHKIPNGLILISQKEREFRLLKLDFK